MSINGERLLRNAEHRISSPFGYRINPVTKQQEGHNGTDYATFSKKVPCYAPIDGEVMKVSVDKYGANFVYVRFATLNKVGLYYHLDSVAVKAGQILTRDTKVGIVGTTGQSTGIHLHFSWIEDNGQALSYYGATYIDFEKYVFTEEEEEEMKRFNKVSELPKGLQKEAQAIIDCGALKGDQNENLNVTEDMIRTMITSKRYADSLKK